MEVTQKQLDKITSLFSRYNLPTDGLKELTVNTLLDDSETGSLEGSVGITTKSFYVLVLRDGSSHT